MGDLDRLAADLSDAPLRKDGSVDTVGKFASWDQTRTAADELIAGHLAMPLDEYVRLDAGA